MIDLDVAASSPDEARAAVGLMCEQLLANPLIESYEISLTRTGRGRRERREARPRIGVIVFPGSNDDRDAAWALGSLGADAVLVWHGDE